MKTPQKRRLFRHVALLLATLMMMGGIGTAPIGAAEETNTNLALGKSVTATSNYVPVEGYYSAAFLVDGELRTIEGGNVKLGWSSDPLDTTLTDPEKPIDITVDLGYQCSIATVVIHPMLWANGTSFPTAYRLQASPDNVNWVDIGGEENINQQAPDFMTTPHILPVSDCTARYVRIHITKASPVTDATGVYLSQIGEWEVLGKLAEERQPSLNKTALRMQPGETDCLTMKDTDDAATYLSSDESIVRIDAQGKVTAIAQGNAVITVTCGGETYTCNVTIDNYSPLDHFMITTFRSPSKAHLNAETYDLLKAAGFTNIQNEWNTSVNTIEDNLEMARLCYERGMYVTVSIAEWHDGFAGLTPEEVQERISLFSHIPGVGGIYLLDEPYNANPYAAAFEPMKELLPYADIHLNFLPMSSYPDETTYQAQIIDFYTLTGGRLDYLMFDRYPFGLAADSFDEKGWYENLDAVRKCGLELDANTGTFMQSIGMRNGYRKPNGDELRFNAYSAVAFGYKQIGYFCWETPNEIDYGFTSAIVDTDGNPTEIYEPVAATNNELLQLGPTLMKLDALEIYVSGTACGFGSDVPADYFLQFEGNPQMLVSYMRHRENGDDYTMLVNRDLKAEQTITFSTIFGADEIPLEIRNDNGEERPLTANDNGTYTITLRPGAGILLKMPASCDYMPGYGTFTVPPEGTNVALDAKIAASCSLGESGQYLAFVHDGILPTTNSRYRGWDSGNIAQGKAWLEFDLRGVTPINHVVLSAQGTGRYFPKAYTVQVSVDGENWTTVATVTDGKNADENIYFSTVSARYVKIDITEMYTVGQATRAQLAEVQIFAAPTPTETEPPASNPPETEPPTGENASESQTSTNTTSGCGSAISGSVILSSLAAVALAFKKKKDEE